MLMTPRADSRMKHETDLKFTLAVIEWLDELHLGEVNAEKVDRLRACA